MTQTPSIAAAQTQQVSGTGGGRHAKGCIYSEGPANPSLNLFLLLWTELCSPQIHMFKSQPLVPLNMTLVGEKSLKMKLSYNKAFVGKALIQSELCPNKKSKKHQGHAHTEKDLVRTQ